MRQVILFSALALVAAVLTFSPVLAGDGHNPIASCKKAGCIKTDKDGNIACTSGKILATKNVVDEAKGKVFYTDADGNLVNPDTGDTLAAAIEDKDGNTFYQTSDSDAVSCPFCALGKCGDSCKADKAKVCSHPGCSTDGKTHVHKS